MTPMQWVMLFTSATDATARVLAALEKEPLPTGNVELDQAMKAFHDHQARLGLRFETEMMRLKEEKETDG